MSDCLPGCTIYLWQKQLNNFLNTLMRLVLKSWKSNCEKFDLMALSLTETMTDNVNRIIAENLHKDCWTEKSANQFESLLADN